MADQTIDATMEQAQAADTTTMEVEKEPAKPAVEDEPDVSDDESFAGEGGSSKEGQEDDLTGDGGVIKKILKVGRGTYPEEGSDVTVHYTGTLLDGTKFDSSKDRGDPFTFKLGNGQVIAGWDKAVAKMRRGEVSMVTIEPQYGYGAEAQGTIPPNSTLQFEIELISWCGDKDISKDLNKSLILKQLKEGTGNSWENPTFDSLVTFTAKCTSGNARSYDNVTLRLGHNEVKEKGLCRALRKMGKEEVAVVTAKANTKYNELDADQVWDVTLHDFKKAEDSWSMDGPKKIAKAKELKDKGNEFYKEKNWRFAGKFYKHAYTFVNSDYKLSESEKVEAKALKAAIASNHAAVALQRKDWAKAKELANKALESDHENVKALLRLGKAENELDVWDAARKHLNQAIFIAQEKGDQATVKDAKTELAKIAAKDRAQFQNESKLFAGLFDKIRQPSPPRKEAPPAADQAMDEEDEEDEKAGEPPAADAAVTEPAAAEDA